jgi:hypothetical protein
MNEKRKRLVLINQSRFKHSCEEIFKLLCPVKEDDWLPGWREQRKLIYSESGFAELGCVFVTSNLPHLMGPATWVNNIYKPFETIQYSAVNENLIYQIHFDLMPLEESCDVVLKKTWTALTLGAEEFLGKMEKETKQKLPNLFELINHYLKTGKMMSS